MPEVTIQTAKTADRIVFLSNLAKVEIANKIGLKVEDLDDNDVKKLKLVELMTKNKKPVEFVISFDGTWFTLYIKVGSFKHEFNSINLVEDRSVKDKQKVMKNLIQYGAATQAQLDALNERNLLDQ
ncbi:MAG TPA: hypothetical protein VFE51_13385 [Verrucomicrobiae bacterium]|nr:hypothetical protein [Verrucomicrobiae bacterium]